MIGLEPAAVIPASTFHIYDDLSDAWSQEDDEISDQYLHLRRSLKVIHHHIIFEFIQFHSIQSKLTWLMLMFVYVVKLHCNYFDLLQLIELF